MNLYHVLLAIVCLGFTRTWAHCTQNTICFEERDTINQVNEAAVRTELNRQGFGRRAWYIQPQREEFNAILAFKANTLLIEGQNEAWTNAYNENNRPPGESYATNGYPSSKGMITKCRWSSMNFTASPLAMVLIIAYSSKSNTTTQYLTGDLGNFEIVITDTIGVMVFVPIRQNQSVDFVLNYYTGCEIMKSSQDQVSYSPPRQVGFPQRKCWLVQPNDNQNKRKVFFSVRDVKLSTNSSLLIWDIHTSKLILSAQGRKEDRLVQAVTENYPFILVDLVCADNQCNNEANSFFVSYYALNQEEVECVNRTEQCINGTNVEGVDCTASCPAFDRMLLEEYALEAGPILRSGTDDDDNFEINDEIIRRRCLLPKKYCQCPSGIPKNLFCDKRVKCLKITRCAFACIVYKYTYCLNISVLDTIILL